MAYMRETKVNHYIELCLEKATWAFETSALWVRKLKQVLWISLILSMVDFIIWDDNFLWREGHQTIIGKLTWFITLFHDIIKGKHIYRSNCLSSIRIICYQTVLTSSHCLFFLLCFWGTHFINILIKRD